MNKLEKFNPYMTCEGKTDKQYFEHLVRLINAEKAKKRILELEPVVTKNPAKFAKSATFPGGKKWYHIIDRETSSGMDTKGFASTLNSLAKVKSKARPILGYSNVSFELWLLLHKCEMRKMVLCARDYWTMLQKFYHLEDISGFDKYKNKQTFSRVLKQISLYDVVQAINNAELIEKHNEGTCSPKSYAGFKYYEENPSLSIHKVVKDILKETGLM